MPIVKIKNYRWIIVILLFLATTINYVDRAVVTYSNAAKVELLGVSEALIREEGAVSEPVGLAMAIGVRESAGVEIGVGVTGIAGPGGGSDRKPVGTVVIAVAWPDGQRVRTLRLPGNREQVRFQASQTALDMVRRALMDLESASSRS